MRPLCMLVLVSLERARVLSCCCWLTGSCLLSLSPAVADATQVQLTLDLPFDCLGSVYNVLAKHGATAGGEEYTDKGKVRLLLTADADAADGIIRALADATSGKVKAQLVEQQE